MTSSNVPVNMSSYPLMATLQPQTSQPDVKTPTLATPIGGQQTTMQSLFPFEEQKSGGVSPNFLSLNAFGNLSNSSLNLSNSSLLQGLTVTSPIASSSNVPTTQVNNNILTPLQTPTRTNANQVLNPFLTNNNNITAINNNNNNNINKSPINASNLTIPGNSQTSNIGRSLVPDGQSGLFPNVGHTPLMADAMKAYNNAFPQQMQSIQSMQPMQPMGTSGTNTNINFGTTANIMGRNKSLSEMGLSESFSDLKIESGQQVQNTNQIIPSMVGIPSQQAVPVDMISNDALFELSRERSMPEGLTVSDGLFRGDSTLSTISQGNAHFVLLSEDEQQVSDGGIGASPTTIPRSGPPLQFAMQMGQQIPQQIQMNNSGINVMNTGSLMNGMPAVPGFPPMTTMLNYDPNGMVNMDNTMSKTYPTQEYWPPTSFGIPVSHYNPMDLNMSGGGGMSPTSSNPYGLSSYTSNAHNIPSQMHVNEYTNLPLMSDSQLENQNSMMGKRRPKQHSNNTSRGGNTGNNSGGGGSSGGSSNIGGGSGGGGGRRNRNTGPRNNNTSTNGSGVSTPGGTTRNTTNDLDTNFERDNISLMDLVKNELIEKCARDQHGSRFIQRALETATLTEKSAVFKQIEKCALGLCEDVFGNYVIQKFFEHGTDNHKITLAKILIGRVLPLTKSMYGCRVIQKALESVEQNMRIALVSELDGHVEECVRDQNGNHVIQKAIEEVAPEHLDFIVKTFDGKVYDFSTHPYGCRVIQRLLERCTLEQKEPLLKEILKQVTTLSKDQYGNYVVQHVLQHGTPEARMEIIQVVALNIVAMSRQKFSSNVVEKSFTNSNEKEKDYLIEHIMGFNSDTPPIVQMVRDQYGNYVIQKILETATQQQRNRLINRIFELVPNLRKLMFGKHIINKIERITGNQYK